MQEATIHVCQCEACQLPDFDPDKLLHHRINLLVSRMDEQQRRWYVASESMRIGYGGDVRLQLITGMHVETIRRGRTELENDLRDRPLDRVRLEGAGRRAAEEDPALVQDLIRLIPDHTAGDPMNDSKWVRRSLGHLSDDLAKQGHQASPNTVGRLLRGQGITPKANRKDHAGPSHPDRNLQFEHIQQQREAFAAAGGSRHQRRWQEKGTGGKLQEPRRRLLWQGPTGQHLRFPQRCRVPGHALRRLRPQTQLRHGRRGHPANTRQFAVDNIEDWWDHEGLEAYAKADKLRILADGGVATATAHACSSAHCKNFPTEAACRSPSVITPPALRNGIRYRTGRSARSASTGRASRYRPCTRMS